MAPATFCSGRPPISLLEMVTWKMDMVLAWVPDVGENKDPSLNTLRDQLSDVKLATRGVQKIHLYSESLQGVPSLFCAEGAHAESMTTDAEIGSRYSLLTQSTSSGRNRQMNRDCSWAPKVLCLLCVACVGAIAVASGRRSLHKIFFCIFL